MNACAGCGVELPPSRSNRPRKWCSESCRKRTMYGGTCEDCGAPTNGSEGHGPNAPKVCARCVGRRAGERSRLRALPQRELVERLWAEGKTCREIADLLGWTASPSHSIARLRQQGYNLPHRRSPEGVANITAANRAMVARREKAAA